MFKSLLSKFVGSKEEKPRNAPAKTYDEFDPPTAALMRAIDEKRKSDPLIGAKLGAKEVFQKVIDGMKHADPKGVHYESLLCILGSLAGYSCQANLRAQALEKGLPETAPFIKMGTENGKLYFFGDPLNQVLAEAQYSIWGLAAGAAKQNGCKSFPDLHGIFAHVTESVGTEAFGIPRLPEGRVASDLPINYLKSLWPVIFPTVKMFCRQPSEWPFLFGLTIQQALDMGKDVCPNEVALQIVMECAIPMSKVDLAAA